MDLKRAAEGLTIVGIGLILLANTLGYLPWSVWWNVLSLWPLLIVAAGLDIIGRGTDNTWLRVLSSLLVVGGLLYGAFVMTSAGRWFPVVSFEASQSTAFDKSEPHNARVKSGTAEISGGFGEFTLGAGRDLVSASGETPFDAPVFDVAVSGNEATVDVGVGESPQAWQGSTRSSIDVLLDRSVVWDLTIKAGVATTKADLGDLMLSALDVEAGVSDSMIELGRIRAASGVTALPVRIEAGVSTLELRIPRGAQARISVQGGISSINVGDGIKRVSDGDDKRYETAGFDDGDAFYDVVIEGGVGAIDIQLY